MVSDRPRRPYVASLGGVLCVGTMAALALATPASPVLVLRADAGPCGTGANGGTTVDGGNAGVSGGGGTQTAGGTGGLNPGRHTSGANPDDPRYGGDGADGTSGAGGVGGTGNLPCTGEQNPPCSDGQNPTTSGGGAGGGAGGGYFGGGGGSGGGGLFGGAGGAGGGGAGGSAFASAAITPEAGSAAAGLLDEGLASGLESRFGGAYVRRPAQGVTAARRRRTLIGSACGERTATPAVAVVPVPDRPHPVRSTSCDGPSSSRDCALWSWHCLAPAHY